MIKFITVLLSVYSFNFLISFNTTSQPSDVALQFSDKAIAVESGQPVYEMGTKVWISNPQKKEIKLFLNEEVKEINGVKVDLSEITNLKTGTYTVIVNTVSDEKTFGFTIQ